MELGNGLLNHICHIYVDYVVVPGPLFFLGNIALLTQIVGIRENNKKMINPNGAVESCDTFWSSQSFSVMSECDKQGNSCPSRLKCVTRDNITHECGCEKTDDMVKGEGKKRFCKGKIMFIFSGPSCWKGG